MSAAGPTLIRLRTLQEARGWLGLGRFLMTRLVRTQSDLVFACHLSELEDRSTESDFGPGRLLLTIDRTCLDDPELKPVLRQLLAGEGAVYLPGLQRDDMALAVVDHEGRVLHRSFVQFETRYKSILGEAAETPLIANCHTVAAARGQGLYPKTLRHAAILLAERGHDRAIVTCDAANTPSIRGIIRAGFREVRAIISLLILLRLVIQRVRWPDERTTWRVVWA